MSRAIRVLKVKACLIKKIGRGLSLFNYFESSKRPLALAWRLKENEAIAK
jgi:hypothetical protein